MVFPKQGTGESHGEDGAQGLPQLQFPKPSAAGVAFTSWLMQKKPQKNPWDGHEKDAARVVEKKKIPTQNQKKK